MFIDRQSHFGIDTIKSKIPLFVLLRAYKKKLVSKKELIDLVNEIVFSGFRISQELYLQVLKEIQEI